MAEDYLLAARRYLVSFTGLTDLLGSDPVRGPWLFINKFSLDLEGTESAAVILRLEPGGSPGRNSVRYIRVVCLIYVDALRDATGNVRQPQSNDRVEAIVAALDKILNRVDSVNIMLSTLRVISSLRTEEISYMPHETDTDARTAARISYTLLIA